MKYTINAEGKRIGRVATEVAVLLMGKNNKDFARNVLPDVSVTVTNASKAKIDDKKMDQKTYKRYSGYPGGLKTHTMAQVSAKKGNSELFKEAISGMLPKNRMRSKMMNNLTITE